MHPLVRGSVPRSDLVLSVALAWLQAAAMTGVVVALGRGVDLLASGGAVASVVPVLVVCVAVAAAATAADAVHSAAAQARAERILRAGVVESIFRAGVPAAASRSGELLALATDSVERAAHYRATFIGPIIGSFTTPLVVLAVTALAIDPVLAAWLALMVVVVPFVIVAAQRAVRRSGGENRRERARLTSAFLTNVQGLATLVAARAAERAARRLAEQGERHRRCLMRLLARNQVLILVMDASVSLGIVLVAVLLAARRLSAGELSLGGAVAGILVALLVIRPVDSVGSFFYIGIGGRAAERALTDQLSRFPGEDGEGGEDGERSGGGKAGLAAIEFERVTAGWIPGRPVVQDLSLRVDAGEHVALVGPSGVGKSTVSALLQAHLLPTAGRVRVAGEATRATSAARIRSGLAVVEQRTFLFHGTIADNLRIAAADVGEPELWRALGAAGLDREVREMPLGLDTVVGEHGLTLSGGQSQRLAIARAVLRDAPILILDEPTSQVDLAGEAAFLRSLSSLASDRTVLMIAHRPGAILAADRVIRLDPRENP